MFRPAGLEEAAKPGRARPSRAELGRVGPSWGEQRRTGLAGDLGQRPITAYPGPQK